MTLLFFLLLPYLEDSQSLYQKAPADWLDEVIPFPLGFAPEIDLKGVEELRFAPNWRKADSPEFFSYSFVWWLDGDVAVDHAMLEKNLGLYYRGLYQAVSKTKSADPSTFKISVQTTRERAWVPQASANYRATIEWVEPFTTEKPLTLHLMLASWRCEGKTALFVLVSPQSSDHAVWQKLKDLRAGACP